MHIICRHCSLPLSNNLKLVALSEGNDKDGEDFLPSGTLMRDESGWMHEMGGEYIANVADVIHAHLTDDPSRLNGCCELDGLDGPNLRCDGCEAYVATKMTDCWRSRCVLFDRDAVVPAN